MPNLESKLYYPAFSGSLARPESLDNENASSSTKLTGNKNIKIQKHYYYYPTEMAPTLSVPAIGDDR